VPDTADILEAFSRLDGVHGAVVLSRDGQVRAHHLVDFPDRQLLSEAVHRSLGIAARLTGSLNQGTLTQQALEFEDFQVIVEILEGGHALAVAAAPTANLGRIRLELRKNRKAVESSLA
jgi:predicted regulator of Ras-like GTPase activity (Roadblock/LC7/MglB family)